MQWYSFIINLIFHKIILVYHTNKQVLVHCMGKIFFFLTFFFVNFILLSGLYIFKIVISI